MKSVSTNSTFDLSNNDMTIKVPDISEIFHIVFQVLLFCVGLYFQVKTILVCIEEKNKTWQIHISHAIVMTVYYGCFIPFYSITYFIPYLAAYTGSWICYLSAFVAVFCYQAIMVHSLLVAIMKYIFIVHTWKARLFGDERIQKIFLWIAIIYPVTMAIATILLTTNYQNRSEIKSCFGKLLNNSSNSGIHKSLFVIIPCDLGRSSDNNSILIYVAKGVCLIRSLLGAVINTNLPEGLLYFKIFSQMKR